MCACAPERPSPVPPASGSRRTLCLASSIRGSIYPSDRASGSGPGDEGLGDEDGCCEGHRPARRPGERSEEHTSELQSLMRISYAVFCLKKKKKKTKNNR